MSKQGCCLARASAQIVIALWIQHILSSKNWRPKQRSRCGLQVHVPPCPYSRFNGSHEGQVVILLLCCTPFNFDGSQPLSCLKELAGAPTCTDSAYCAINKQCVVVDPLSSLGPLQLWNILLCYVCCTTAQHTHCQERPSHYCTVMPSISKFYSSESEEKATPDSHGPSQPFCTTVWSCTVGEQHGYSDQLCLGVQV